jgi:hypothetical protein
MEGCERDAADYAVKGFSGIVVDTYTWCVCEQEAVNSNLLDNDGAEAGLMLMTELKFVKYTIEHFHEKFDLKSNTDLKGLVLSGFKSVEESQFF